ncbi:unnamed protein product [Mycena citricolor]|uniref:Uncharacterized protein n=1 Tax=Mycena citricolor TaxID=2018698 RepID=A0AAD2JWI1_9AGAR|nr:unnamed protein product [Mycena citricolor]
MNGSIDPRWRSMGNAAHLLAPVEHDVRAAGLECRLGVRTRDEPARARDLAADGAHRHRAHGFRRRRVVECVPRPTWGDGVAQGQREAEPDGELMSAEFPHRLNGAPARNWGLFYRAHPMTTTPPSKVREHFSAAVARGLLVRRTNSRHSWWTSSVSEIM